MIKDSLFVKSKQAWLITWEWVGDHAEVENKNKIVAILSYRYGNNTIKKIVEQIYASNEFALHEQLAYAQNRKTHPYKAQLVTIGIPGTSFYAPFEKEVTCGDNPYLSARKVYDIKAYIDENGNEKLKWEERINPILKNGEIQSDRKKCDYIS